MAERRGYCNCTRSGTLNARLGTVEVQIPQPREGGYVPLFLEERKRTERALAAAVLEMVISGVSTRKVECMIRELGVVGISKSQVSVLCAQLDGAVKAFRERPTRRGVSVSHARCTLHQRARHARSQRR